MGYTKEQNNTQSKRKLQSYINLCRVIAKDNAPALNLLQDLETQMAGHNALLSKLSTPFNGTTPPITSTDVLVIQRNLSNMHSMIEQYLKTQKKQNGLTNALIKVNNILAKDFKTFSSVIPDGKVTLPELISLKKNLVVDLGNAKTGALSGNLSQRIPLTLQDKKKGLFTAKTDLDFEKMARDKMVKWKQVYPNLKNMFTDIENTVAEMQQTNKDMGFRYLFSQYQTGESVSIGNDNKTRRKVKHVQNGLEEMIPIFEKYGKQQGFNAWVTEMANFDLTCEGLESLYIEDPGIEEGANIDGRNSAMSAVADLLGCSGLIAKAVPMTIKIDGQTIQGTFMEYAEGSDFNNPVENDVLLQTSEKNYSNVPGLKSVANLGVLDYICGNTDRHAGNMLYQYGGPSGKDLVGVVGIDNDLSFGNLDPDLLYDTGFGRMSGITGLKVIGADMAAKIMTVSPEFLKMNLRGFGLTEKEIDLAGKRLLSVQNAINNKIIKVVPDNEWTKYKLSDLVDKDMPSTFSELNDVATHINSAKKNLARSQKSQIDKIMPSGNYIKKGENINERLKKISEKMTRFCERLDAENNGFFIGSQKYRNMKSYANSVRLQFLAMSKVSRPPEMTQTNFEKYMMNRSQHMLSELRDISDKYVKHKLSDGSLGKSDIAVKRTLLAMEIKDFASNNCNKLDGPVEDIYRNMSAAMRAQKNKPIVKNAANDKPDKGIANAM